MFALFIVFFLSGANITYLMQFIFHRHFPPLLFINLSILNSLLLPPLALLLYYRQSLYISTVSIALIYSSFALIPLLWPFIHSFLLRWFPEFKPQRFFLPRSIHYHHPLLIAILIIFAITTFNILQYSFLPTPDSYSWLILHEEKLHLNQIPAPANDGRAAFSALIASIYFLTDIKLFYLFKYFLPYLSLLALIPLYLAAQHLRSKYLQLLLLFGLLISPTVILEMGYIRQQILFLLFLYFAVGLAVHAHHRRDSLLFYLIGFYALLGSFIHPAFLIFILTWLLSLFLSKLSWIIKYKYRSLLIFILAIPLADRFNVSNMFIRIYEQARASLFYFLQGHWNLKFPTFFINSDNYEMSWPGLSGVVKYYAYYAGPVIGAITIFFIYLLFVNKQVRAYLRQILISKYTSVILAPVLLLLLIAEIAPRFGNIAFLPDRAWQYLGILLVFFLFSILSLIDNQIILRPKPVQFFFCSILLITFSVSVGGASYINHLTKYTMPDYEFAAITWIQDNFHSSSRIFSSSSKNILRYHAQAIYHGFSPDHYSLADSRSIIEHMSSQVDIPTKTHSDLTRISALLSEIADESSKAKQQVEEGISHNKISIGTFEYLHSTKNAIQLDINELTTKANAAHKIQIQNQVAADNLPDLYIYYAKTHPKNPYASRPYQSSFTTDQDILAFPALDGDNSSFKRVYTARDNVIIWQVLTKDIHQ